MGQAHEQEEARAGGQPCKAQRRLLPVGSLLACRSCRRCLLQGRGTECRLLAQPSTVMSPMPRGQQIRTRMSRAPDSFGRFDRQGIYSSVMPFFLPDDPRQGQTIRRTNFRHATQLVAIMRDSDQRPCQAPAVPAYRERFEWRHSPGPSPLPLHSSVHTAHVHTPILAPT